MTYAIVGAFFMPFLAGMLLWMNNRKSWVGEAKNPWLLNTLLLISLGVFGYLCVVEITDALK